ncbi:MAG TPA: FCD domain-containing protein [Accumulibacter sp.]|nr:FCD domain-containing protein [Accumulibacter sp.]HMW18480.1 FCD domain-containing protein [Accumulibacter sp.]HMX23072.1 FCD domain-containing protein [Accumulibacter sp.]HMY06775.1 FCD domain-containing protein [Accumulibacter sp.]HNC18668.1 FCD domain-containing protein [Accumulibacter sp.]
MTYTKLNLPRIPDAIAHQLELRILEGSLKPGDRLPAERELALELGVSRPSLREAIKKLVSRDLLVSRHGGGTFVTNRLEATFSDPWQRLIDQHPFLQDDVLEFRYLLEASAASLAAQRGTDDDLQRLEQAFQRLDAAYQSDDRSAQVAADVAFHLTIAEAAHNALYAHLVSSVMRLLHDHVRRTLKEIGVATETRQQLTAQHRIIVDAIKTRRPDAAWQAAQTHIDFVRQRINEATSAGIRPDKPMRYFS